MSEEKRNLEDARNAIIEGIDAEKFFKEVRGHNGSVNAETFKTWSAKGPACLVVFSSFNSILNKGNGVFLVDANWALYLLMTHGQRAKIDEMMLHAFAEMVVLLDDKNQKWGGVFESPPTNVQGRNMTTADFEKKVNGANLGVVNFRQKVRLKADVDGNITPLKIICAEYDFAPPDGKVDASDEIDTE